MQAVNASYEVQWGNPLWVLIGFAVDSESPQVLELLQRSLDKFPPVDPATMDLSDAALHEAFGIPLPPWLGAGLWTPAGTSSWAASL